MGASHRGLNCFKPQTTVGVLTVPFSSQDIQALESSKGHGKSLSFPFLLSRLAIPQFSMCGGCGGRDTPEGRCRLLIRKYVTKRG